MTISIVSVRTLVLICVEWPSYVKTIRTRTDVMLSRLYFHVISGSLPHAGHIVDRIDA